MSCSSNSSHISNVQHFDMFVNNQNLDEFVKSVINKIRPAWDSESITIKFFEGGTSNNLAGIHKKQSRDEEIDYSTTDIILVRIYGNNTDMIINRQQELWNFNELSANQIASTLFCTFNNGYCYQFINGDVIKPEELKDKTLLEKTAKLVAKIHSTKLSQKYLEKYSMEGTVFGTVKKYMEILPEQFECPEKQKRLNENGLSLDCIKEELNTLETSMSKMSGREIAFCHNDLNCPNIIFNRKTAELFCIDYEYACPNYISYDIGNFFNEFPGNTDIDFSLYPNKETQLFWLRAYLEEKYRLQGSASGMSTSDTHLLKLYVEVNRFALVSHLLWGVWALIQAHYSDIDFDFVGYSIIRFKEYFKRKDEILSMDVKNLVL